MKVVVENTTLTVVSWVDFSEQKNSTQEDQAIVTAYKELTKVYPTTAVLYKK